MAVSFSRPDPSSAADIAGATFGTVRRGFDQAEVRDFLRMVSAELGRLQERERFLERELAAAREPRRLDPSELDEETVTALVGEETARVLATAREAAGQIRGRAEEGAARMLREAQEHATKLRTENDLDASRRRQDAAREVEAELEHARQQGRDMVNEARDYRERVLADINRRREQSKQQLQQMAAGRERLVQAFERARLVSGDILAEVQTLGSELDEETSIGHPPLDHVIPPARERTAEPIVMRAETRPEPVEVIEVEVVEVVEVEVEVVEVEVVEVVAADAVVTPAAETAPPARLAPVVVLYSADTDTIETSEDEAPLPGADADIDVQSGVEPGLLKSSVDDLFARLKASRPAAVAEAVADQSERHQANYGDGDGEPDGPGDDEQSSESPALESEPTARSNEADADEDPFAERDQQLAEFEAAIARRLKRVLADEQNDVLDLLRRKESVRSSDVLLPSASLHLASYVDAVSDDVAVAAEAGAYSLVNDDALVVRRLADSGVVASVLAAVESELVGPLRQRLDRATANADGDNGELTTHAKAIYREIKSQRLDDLAGELAAAAFGRGRYAVLVPGTPIVWLADARCPDGARNAAVGTVPAGTTFPTGDRCAPTHSTCRCLIAPA